MAVKYSWDRSLCIKRPQIMKTIATLVLLLLIGFTAQAKDASVAPFETGFVTAVKEVKVAKENEVARLYRFSNSQVKKELSFTTKNNKAKLA
jgi:hypothetical protein